MSDDQSAAGRRFQIHHDSLESAATRALPDQVSALGNTRRSLMARQVPVEAFGRVAASVPAGAGHAGTVAENARRLAAASGRLEEIIGGVRQVNAAVRDWDDWPKVVELDGETYYIQPGSELSGSFRVAPS